MQTETSAPIDTTTAPAAADPALQTQAPPANGEQDATQGQPDGKEPLVEGAEDQGTQQDDQPRDDQGRFKPKVQKRIDELTHARRAAERERDYWRSQAESRQAAAPAPQPHEFADDAQYEAAVRRHEIKQAAREEIAETAKATADRFDQDARQATAETYNQRVQEAAVRIPDFVDVVGKADIQISDTLRDALMDSDHGPDIVYKLAKDPAMADRLSQMDERALYRELGRMEAGMLNATFPPATVAKAAQAAPAARTTSAPPPVKPSGASGAAPNTDPSTMTQAQFEAWARVNGAKHF